MAIDGVSPCVEYFNSCATGVLYLQMPSSPSGFVEIVEQCKLLDKWVMPINAIAILIGDNCIGNIAVKRLRINNHTAKLAIDGGITNGNPLGELY